VAALCGALLGAALALQVPLTPLVAAQAPHDPGGATAYIGLGSGGANLVGPLIASVLLPVFGPAGVIVTFAVLYLAQAAMILALHEPAPGAAVRPGAQPSGASTGAPAAHTN
jgi:hypothetical protein